MLEKVQFESELKYKFVSKLARYYSVVKLLDFCFIDCYWDFI